MDNKNNYIYNNSNNYER